MGRGGEGVMVAATKLADFMCSAMQDVGFGSLDCRPCEVLMYAYPRDRVAAPVEARIVIHDGEVHRHENPVRLVLRDDLSNDIWIRAARRTELAYCCHLHAAKAQTLRQLSAIQLLVQHEERHAASGYATAATASTQRTDSSTSRSSRP